MQQLKRLLAFVAAMCVLVPSNLMASSHREAPISALDHSADVTDWYGLLVMATVAGLAQTPNSSAGQPVTLFPNT